MRSFSCHQWRIVAQKRGGGSGKRKWGEVGGGSGRRKWEEKVGGGKFLWKLHKLKAIAVFSVFTVNKLLKWCDASISLL